MRQLDPRIVEVLLKYGEDPTDTKGVVWDCHGTWVVYHRAIERIAAKAGVRFDAPTILRAERDEAVILVFGEFENRRDWDIGECLLNVNYRVSGRQAAYVWAMATKRARDRVVLKLIGLHGLLYSEDEADDFKDPSPRETDQADERRIVEIGATKSSPPPQQPNGNRMSAYKARKDGRWDGLIKSLRACATMEDLRDWNDGNEGAVKELPANWVNELREEWKARAYEIRTGR